MPKVRCPQRRCVFWEDDYCAAEEIELDPEQLSCLNMEEMEDEIVDNEEIWEEEEDLLEEEDEWSDEEEEEEEDEDEWPEDEEDEEEEEFDGFAMSDEDDDRW
jgi:hypothetical protein